MLIQYISSADPWKTIDGVLGTRLPNTHHIVQYNIQPGDLLTILRAVEGQWKMDKARWAWKSYDGQIDQTIINARVEGIYSQNAFRFAIRNRRCIIPVDGFYSVTQRPGRDTLAHRVAHREGQPLFAAAVTSEDGSCVNPLTSVASTDIAEITDRQLCVFDNKADVQAWCDPALKVGQLDALIKKSLKKDLIYYAVTADVAKDVNSPILHERRHRHLTLFD